MRDVTLRQLLPATLDKSAKLSDAPQSQEAHNDVCPLAAQTFARFTGNGRPQRKMAASSRVDIASAAGHSVSLLQSSKTAAKFAHDVLLCQQPSGIPR